MWVWEWGVGIILVCGIGVCVIVVVVVLIGWGDCCCMVELFGGNLEIEWFVQDNWFYMMGLVQRVFSGQVEI